MPESPSAEFVASYGVLGDTRSTYGVLVNDQREHPSSLLYPVKATRTNRYIAYEPRLFSPIHLITPDHAYIYPYPGDRCVFLCRLVPFPLQYMYLTRISMYYTVFELYRV